MSAWKPPQNQAAPPPNSAWEEAQRAVRDRNEATRRAGKQQRVDEERRVAAARRARDLRDGVSR
jgi:hypothetical protein